MTKASRRKARRIRAAKVAIAELRVAQRRAARAAGTQASPKLYTRKDRELLRPVHGSIKQRDKHANKRYARSQDNWAAELARTEESVRSATRKGPLPVTRLAFFGSVVPFLIYGNCAVSEQNAASIAADVVARMTAAMQTTSAEGYEWTEYGTAEEHLTRLANHLAAEYPHLTLVDAVAASAAAGLAFRMRFRYDRAFLEIGWLEHDDDDEEMIGVCALAASRDDVTGEPYAGHLDRVGGVKILAELLSEATLPVRGRSFSERLSNTVDLLAGSGGDPSLPTLIR